MHCLKTRILTIGLVVAGMTGLASAGLFEWSPYGTSNSDWLWTQTISGGLYVNNWGRTGNPVAMPAAGDDVHIGPVSGKPSPTISAEMVDVKTVTIAAGTSLSLSSSNLTIEGSGLTTASPITLTSSQISFNGASAQLSTSSPISLTNGGLFVTGASLLLTGGGSISLGNGGLAGAASSEVTNQNLNITGYGGITNSSLVNRATIRATGSNQTLALASSQIRNEGTLAADTGAILVMPGNQVQNTGSIAATGTGQIQINSSTVTGGTISGETDSLVNITSSTLYNLTLNAPKATILGTSTLDNVTIRAQTAIDYSSTTTVQTAMSIGGTLSNSGTLSLSGTVPFSGTGDLKMSGIVTGAGRLINTLPSIHGVGQFSGTGLTVENRAEIAADTASGGLGFVDSSFTNKGAARARNGGILAFDDATVDNTSGTIEMMDTSTFWMSGGTLTGGSVTVGASGRGVFSSHAGISNLTLNGSYVTMAGTADTDGQLVLGGQINNNGLLQIAGDTTHSGDVRLNGTVALTGSGAIELVAGSQDSLIQGTSTGGTLINSGNTIRGAGYIGPKSSSSYTVQLQNLSGTIQADQSGDRLTLDTGNTINRSTICAKNGGFLTLKKVTLDNTNGVIDVQGPQSNVNLAQGSITGGVIRSSGGAFFDVAESRLYDLTNQGTIQLRDGATHYLYRTICNNGTIQGLGLGIQITKYNLSEDLTLTGTGMFSINAAGNRNAFIGANHRLTNSQGHTISGAMYAGGRDLAITNAGLMEATAAGDEGTMYLRLARQSPDGTAGLLIQPTGTLRARSGSTVYVDNALITNNGTIEADQGTVQVAAAASCSNYSSGTLTGGTWRVANSGTLNVDPNVMGNITTNNANVIYDGAAVFSQFSYLAANQGSLTLRNGNIFATRGNLSNSGTLDVGAGCQLRTNGALTQTATGRLNVNASGTAPAQISLVQATGAAAVGGELHVAFAKGFSPAVGTEFTILTCGSRTGTFASVTGPSPCEVVYSGTSVKIRVKALAIPGDIDEDRSVTLADLKLLVAAWNTTGASSNWNAKADIDNDGAVTLGDLKILVANWNRSLN